MLSEGQKRKGTLSILEKLRSQGAPEKEAGEEFDTLFAKVDSENNIVPGSEEDKETPPEKKRKRAYERGDGETRLPAANQPAAKKISNFFRG